jgi:hypothetical protein
MWVELLSAHKEFLTFKLEHELIVEGGGGDVMIGLQYC